MFWGVLQVHVPASCARSMFLSLGDFEQNPCPNILCTVRPVAKKKQNGNLWQCGLASFSKFSHAICDIFPTSACFSIPGEICKYLGGLEGWVGGLGGGGVGGRLSKKNKNKILKK